MDSPKAFATSTECTARFHDLNLELPAGVRTPISNDPATIARVQTIAGVVVDFDPAPPPLPSTLLTSSEEK